MAKNITVENKTLRLQLWDTAGQERFRSLIPSYLKDAAVTFVVFDISSKDLIIRQIDAALRIQSSGLSFATKIENKKQS